MKTALLYWLAVFAVALFFAGMALRACEHPCRGYAFGLMWGCIGGAVVLGMTSSGDPPGSARPRGA